MSRTCAGQLRYEVRIRAFHPSAKLHPSAEPLQSRDQCLAVAIDPSERGCLRGLASPQMYEAA